MCAREQARDRRARLAGQCDLCAIVARPSAPLWPPNWRPLIQLAHLALKPAGARKHPPARPSARSRNLLRKPAGRAASRVARSAEPLIRLVASPAQVESDCRRPASSMRAALIPMPPSGSGDTWPRVRWSGGRAGAALAQVNLAPPTRNKTPAPAAAEGANLLILAAERARESIWIRLAK